MRTVFRAALAATLLYCLPALATGEAQTTLGVPAAGSGIGIVNSSTTCGTTALLFSTPGAGTMVLAATGTFTSGNIRVQAGALDGATFSSDLTVYPRAGGAGATTIAAAGIYTLPLLADMRVCVYGSSFTGAATIQVAFAPTASRVVVSNTSGDPLFVTGSLSVSGTADVVSAGAPTTFNANAICTGSLPLAGEQSASFELNVGTLAATLTPQCSGEVSGTTNFTNGVFKDASGTASNTLVVTNPNALTNLQIVCPGSRRAQVCTTAYTSGSATGLANAVFAQGGAAAGGGGGGVVTQATGTNLHTVTDATSVTAATQSGTWTVQPGNTANTTAWKVDGSAVTQPVSGTVTTTPPSNASTNLAQVAGATVATGHGTAAGAQRVELASDGTGQVAIAGTASVTATGGAAGAASGPVYSVQWPDATGSGNPASVATYGANTVSSVRAPSFAAATNLTTSCSSATACAVTASIQWAVGGQSGAEVVITAIASPVGFTLACDTGYDNNATYLLGDCAFNQAGVFKKTLANADLTAGNKFTLSWLGSPSFVRVRVSAVTSGQFTAAGVASTASSLPWPVEAKAPTQATVTLTASTSETTLLAAGGSGVFLDLTYLKCSNTSATASAISIRDATAGTVRDTLVCPAAIGPCEGNVYRVPFAQTTSNANWTIQAGTSASSLICTAQAVQR